MRYRGMRVLDTTETQQLVWLLLQSGECPDASAERRVEESHFLVPHESWNSPPAFVDPVHVRRTRRRILFVQCAGVLY